MKKRRIIKINAISFAKMCAAMDGTMTKRELSEHVGLHYLTVCHYTREMHRAGACHIVTWEQDSRGRAIMPVFKLGPGRDVKRPCKTPADRSKTYRAKIAAQTLIHSLAGALHEAARPLSQTHTPRSRHEGA